MHRRGKRGLEPGVDAVSTETPPSVEGLEATEDVTESEGEVQSVRGSARSSTGSIEAVETLSMAAAGTGRSALTVVDPFVARGPVGASNPNASAMALEKTGLAVPSYGQKSLYERLWRGKATSGDVEGKDGVREGGEGVADDAPLQDCLFSRYICLSSLDGAWIADVAG